MALKTNLEINALNGFSFHLLAYLEFHILRKRAGRREQVGESGPSWSSYLVRNGVTDLKNTKKTHKETRGIVTRAHGW